MEIESGTVVAQRYRIVRQLGRGGMGEVYAAENVRTGRIVAVKVLRADAKQKTSAIKRFQQEARAAGAISSDFVTQVLDVEDDADHGIVIVFELLEGESLIDRLKRTGPMTFEELFPVVEQVWKGLADAHKSGVIHRDLKPSNVFLERRNDGTVRVKILDFGISKIPREVGGETLTEMGQSLGTFSFMPPEQIGKAKTVDHRADIYACATLIYQAMSGQLPYAAKNILQMVDLKTKSEPRSLGSVLDGQVDPRLEAFLAKGLARDPENRFQSAHEALEAWGVLRRSGISSEPSHVTSSDRSQAQTVLNNRSTSSPQVPAANSSQAGQQQQQGAQQGQPQRSSTAMATPAPQSGGPPRQSQMGMAAMSNPPARTPATVMLADPRSHASSPLPVSPPSGYGMQGQHAMQQPQSPRPVGKTGGTIAINQGIPQVAYAGAAAPSGGPASQKQQMINVPVVNDTTSEGSGDQVATIAMPVRNVAQAVALAQQQAAMGGGVPRVHNDDPSERGQMGTQLMSHAALRQAGAQIPQSAHRTSTPGMNASSVSGSFQSPQAGQQMPHVNAPPGEGADLTTVYRRDKATPTDGQAPQSTRGSRIPILLGVIAFAVVGFAIAAIVLRFVLHR